MTGEARFQPMPPRDSQKSHVNWKSPLALPLGPRITSRIASAVVHCVSAQSDLSDVTCVARPPQGRRRRDGTATGRLGARGLGVSVRLGP